MTIKKDGTGKRWVEMEFLASGTPEQVWHAMATGAGYAAWFTKATIEERAGGSFQFHFGADGSSTSGEVTAWQPPNYFSYVERNWNGNAPPVATEITITARSGGKCAVRMVHSLFSSTDEWDDQIEGFEGGWPGFFQVLHVYLKHFAGRKAASFMAMSNTTGEQVELWKRLQRALDLVGADVDERRTTSAKPEALSGVVEWIEQCERSRAMLLRLESPRPGALFIGTCIAGERVNVSMCMYHYGDDAEDAAASSETKWRAWLSEQFPAAPANAAR